MSRGLPSEAVTAWHVYLLASRKDGVLYVGVTNDLARRLAQHRRGDHGGFTGRYHVRRLVYVEAFGDPYHAIAREKQLKRWRRAWKVALIERENPDWGDLSHLL